MIVPRFINPFCTALGFVPDNNAEPKTTTIELGGCLTDEDEKPVYSEAEWEKRKSNLGKRNDHG